MKNNINHKERSEKILILKKIPYLKSLPAIVNDQDVIIRSKEEIAKRAIALQMVAIKAEGLEQSILKKIISDFSAQNFFTVKEKAFIKKNKPSYKEKADFCWRYECYWVMLWALGYISKLDYPDHLCNVPKAVRILKKAGSYQKFLKDAKLKTKKQILDEVDLIYRLNWACVEARVKKMKTPGDLDPEVVMERHRALNWLINYSNQDWDNVSMDT